MLNLESGMHFLVIVICVLLEVNDEMLTCATWLVAVGSSGVFVWVQTFMVLCSADLSSL